MKNPLPSDIFQPGQILNQTYEIEGVLGRGGTGEVYRAVNLVTGRTFAIKALIARFSDSGIILREEQIRKIVHSAVVRYNECTRTDTGNVILVMDYIPGGSLADAMTAGALTPRDILIVGHRIAEGLAAAHAQGIVHRDLSPDNIILKDGRPDQATLIDFGIAKDTAEGAQTIVEGFAGKYEYAAPEQLDGHADARSDVYAL
ncbi:MAG: serine/threonine-protein kinase, partial [Pseudomonadota bacterium]